MRKLPVGIQSFEKLREEGFLYVDKTEYIYRLAHNNVPYFLSRPRRFGKSLLLSTLRAYWEGKRNLFAGLAVDELESPDVWQAYPVFFFDFNGINYQEKGSLEEALGIHLKRWEKLYGCSAQESSLNERFQELLLNAYEKTSRRSVILVDEYDKPLLDVIGNEELQEHNKEVFKGFFSTLKSFDQYIQFIFITGVSKFHKVSIFSDLNQLNDISLNVDFSGMCGMTEEELRKYFLPEIRALAKRQEMNEEECLATLKQQYDGYHFSADGNEVYNPYSVLRAFFEKDYGSYWFETGTPSFLVKELKRVHFDVRRFTDQTLNVNEAVLKDYTGDSPDPLPLLYQTGYLTIDSYDRRRKRYTLSFPNEEVKYGFLESMMPAYVPAATAGTGLDIYTLDEYIEKGSLGKIRDVLTALFANISYSVKADPFEHYFQAVIYLVFTLLGKFALCEMHTFTGRIDCKVETTNYIYLFEFKRDDSAEAALAQIDSKEYTLPFIADHRTLFKIGVGFDSVKRILSDWKTETVTVR